MELRQAHRQRPGRVRLEPHRWFDQQPLRHRGRHGGVHQVGLRERQALRAQRPGQWPHARVRQPAHRRATRSHRRIRTEPVMSMLAIGWEPEIRGVLTVMIAVVVLCGSIYLIMATNMGARLAFLVVLAGLFGWLFLMGITWWIYGIGLKGPDPTWAEIPGRTVLQDTQALYTAGVLQTLPDVPADATFPEEADIVADQL